MEEEFIKENKIIDKSEDEKKDELINSIINTKHDLIQAHKNFEFAEGGLIDYYAYKIKATQSKLDYLLKLAKINGLVMDKNAKKKYLKNIKNNFL